MGTRDKKREIESGFVLMKRKLLVEEGRSDPDSSVDLGEMKLSILIQVWIMYGKYIRGHQS